MIIHISKMFRAVVFLTLFFSVHSKVEICLNLTQTQFLNKEFAKNVVDDLPSWIYKEHFEFDFKHPAISAKGSLDKLNISNILETNVNVTMIDDADFEGGTKLTFSFENISWVGKYNITGDIGDLFEIFGEGPFWLNTKFTIQVLANVIMEESTCAPVDISLEAPMVDGYFNNFMNPYKNDTEFEELMNKAIINLVPQAIDEFVLEFREAFHDQIQEKINCLTNYNCSTSKKYW